MKRLLLILLCLLMVLGMTACGDKDTGKGNTTTTTQEEDIYYATYAHDLTIDRFFVEYLEKYCFLLKKGDKYLCNILLDGLLIIL